jgi:hypothetical protein
MDDFSEDIFSSDRQFIEFAGSVLIGLGLPLLLLGLSCKLFEWGYCEVRLVAFFSENHRFTAVRDALSVNLPLAMLLMGGSLKLYSRAGWIITVLILMMISVFFGSLSLMTAQVLSMDPVVYRRGLFSSDYWEPMVVDAALCILGCVALLYLFLPDVRKLYWNRPGRKN